MLLMMIERHPATLVAVLYSVFFLVFSSPGTYPRIAVWVQRNGIKLATIAVFVLLCLFAVIIWAYLSTSTLFEPQESQVASVSWMFEMGQPIYHDADSAQRYSQLYGPMLYIIKGFVLAVLGPSFFATKITGVISFAATIVLLFLVQQSLLGNHGAFVSFLYILTAFCIGSAVDTFCSVSDPILLVSVSASLLAVIRGGRWTAAIVTAIALGLSVNIKVHAVLYYLPVLVLLFQRKGSRTGLIAVVGAVIVFAGPFVASAQVSASNYVYWLQMASRHGISLFMLLNNIGALVLLAVPVVVIMKEVEPQGFIAENKHYFIALSVALVGAVLVGSKLGAGERHLIPLIPILAYTAALFYQQRQHGTNGPFWLHSRTGISALAALALVMIPMTVSKLNGTAKYLLNAPHDVEEDIERIIQDHPDKFIAMGYGENDRELFYLYQPKAVFSTGSLLLDVSALMDMKRSGLPIPAGTVDAMRSCMVNLWLVPKGSQPFSTLSDYYQDGKIFSDDLIRAFWESYELEGQTSYYDIYRCRTPMAGLHRKTPFSSSAEPKTTV